MAYTDPSVLHLKFVNGQEKEYHMGMSKLAMLKKDIERLIRDSGATLLLDIER